MDKKVLINRIILIVSWIIYILFVIMILSRPNWKGSMTLEELKSFSIGQYKFWWEEKIMDYSAIFLGLLNLSIITFIKRFRSRLPLSVLSLIVVIIIVVLWFCMIMWHTFDTKLFREFFGSSLY